jgi:ATP-dependent exoDNAse (exonuclease V) beta subunit
LPLDERVADAADEAELDDIYETERRLLYVACTRAREHLLLTGVTPVSEYLADLEAKGRLTRAKRRRGASVAATDFARRANHPFLVNPPSKKYSSFPKSQITV